MSFGEHLEELRSALWKAVLALVIGFLVGLLFGDDLVRVVKQPLTEALARLEQERQLSVYEADGDAAKGDADADLAEDGLVPRRYDVSPQALVELLRGLGVAVEAPPELPDRAPLWLWTPPQNDEPMSTGVPTVFSVYMKASFVVGAVLASPFVFYFLWSFVAAGLYPHEKRYVHLFLPFSIGLFLLGAVVAFYVVLHYVLEFLLGFNAWLGVAATPRINEWLGFVLILPLMFGIGFQLPLVMLFLDRVGLASVELYLKYWRYAVLVIFILSMILTPADPQSLIAMAGCLTPLYFGGVLLCRFLPRRREPFSAPAA